MITAPAQVLSRPKERAPYTPFGAARKAWYSARREVLLCGPSNTGKSRLLLEKLHYCMDRYPGARGLMLRKTMKSLRQTGMVTYEKKVLPQGWLDRLIHFNTQDMQYEYPNESIIAVAGMDDPQKVMSSEWDMIVPLEATEFREEDWQALSIRLRWHHMPYQQMLADCNPGPAKHWLKARCDRGQTLMLYSRHEDNPAVTPEDMAALDALTGVWYKRYRLGLWASAEGAVYDEWDPALHIIDRFDIPPLWPRYWAIDWGFRNPFCWQAWAQNHDGDLYCYREIYVTGQLVEDLACQIMALTVGEPRPVAVVCDHDAEDRATFEKHSGLSTTPAKKAISRGIQAVKKRLRTDRRGRPGIYYLHDSLVERDPTLDNSEKKKAPACTVEEYESYEWDESEGRKRGEVPVDKDNHGCLVAGTLIKTASGDRPIEHIHAGDYVLTRYGYKRVKAAGMTARQAEVFTVHFSNGASLTGTGNHPIYLHEQGYTPLRAMQYGDIIEDVKLYLERYPLCQSSQAKQNASSIKESRSDAIPNPASGLIEATMFLILPIASRALADCIKKSGKMLMDLFQRATTFTTKTVIRLTMPLKTLIAYQRLPTTPITSQLTLKRNWHGDVNGWSVFDQQLLTGISQKKVEPGIVSLALCHGIMQRIATTSVSNVGMSINPGKYTKIIAAFVPMLVSQHGGVMPDLITKPASVSNVGMSSSVTSMLSKPSVQERAQQEHVSLPLLLKQEPVLYAAGHLPQGKVASRGIAQEHAQAVAVLSISKSERREAVYNLTVENAVGEGEYFANGVLVHNCDATRYMVMHIDGDSELSALDSETAAALQGYVGY